MSSCACTKLDVVIAVLCVTLIVLTAGAVSQSDREAMFRQSCANNLASLHKAVQMYCDDYDDEMPKAGGRENEWIPTLANWAAKTRMEAYQMENKAPFSGKVTTTASLYLLVKYAEAKVPQFVCPAEPDTRPLSQKDIPEKLPERYEWINAWDFGGRYDSRNNPSRHCSYAYHLPFGRYVLSKAHDLHMAVMADRNPWLDPNRVKSPTEGWARFKPAFSDVNDPKVRLGNSDAHGRIGQNVLFLDGHVRFETRAACGAGGDNIYTIASDTTAAGGVKGTPPSVYVSTTPLNRRDSVLVQEVPFAVLASPHPATSK
jgi:prepilin-type processing-associated H-X9-DG protein